MIQHREGDEEQRETTDMRKMNQKISLTLLAVLIGLNICPTAIAASDRPPNFVLIYADLSCYANQYYETPCIGRLMGEGIRFTQAYADAPLFCTPSRIALLSGRHSARIGCYDVFPERIIVGVKPDAVDFIPPINNLNLPEDHRIISECLEEILPALLQVESHPHLTQMKLLRFCQESGIAFTAFSPLGAQSYLEIGRADPKELLLESKSIASFGESHGKSAAQVLLRWGVQRGGAVVMKTSITGQLLENMAIFDCEFSNDEMNVISGLNQNRRYNDPGVFCESAFNTFFPIFE